MSIVLCVGAVAAPAVSTDDGDLLFNCTATYGLKYQAALLPDLGLDDNGDPVEPTTEQAAAVPVEPHESTYNSSLCDGEPEITDDSVGAVPGTFHLTDIKRIAIDRHLDVDGLIALAFGAFWLYFEWFWIGFFRRAIKVSLTVLDDAQRKDGKRVPRPRAPSVDEN